MSENPKKWTIRRLTSLSLLFALALVFMFLENMIPPIPTLPPGVKLGLSNIVVMYTLFYFGNKDALFILLLKSAFVFLTRGMISFFMSLSGGLFSIFIMILLLSLKKREVSYIMVSVCAAVAHNFGQLVIASFLMKSTTVYFYLPVLLLSGIFMGLITGTMLKILMPAMTRLKFDHFSISKPKK